MSVNDRLRATGLFRLSARLAVFSRLMIAPEHHARCCNSASLTAIPTGFAELSANPGPTRGHGCANLPSRELVRSGTMTWRSSAAFTGMQT